MRESVATRSLLAAALVVFASLLVAQASPARAQVRSPNPAGKRTTVLHASYDRAAAVRAFLARPRFMRAAHALAPLAASPQYAPINLDQLVGLPASFYLYARAINQNGRIVLSGLDQYEASTPSYVINRSGTYFTLGCPGCDPKNYNDAVGLALDNGLDVVGYWIDYVTPGPPDGQEAAIQWKVHGDSSASVVGFFGPPYGTAAFPRSINDSGVIVGDAGNADGGGYGSVAFNFTSRQILGIDPSVDPCDTGSADSGAYAIDDAGVVVGWAIVPPNCQTVSAVRFPQHGAPVPLNVPAQSIATAINERGVAAGTANEKYNSLNQLLPGAVAFTDALGTGASSRITYLPLPAGCTAENCSLLANAINDAGDVVGDIVVGSGNKVSYGAFVYKNGRTYDLNDLLPAKSGINVVDAVGINDRGEILGTASFANGASGGPILLKTPGS